jgi:hypothetical protein
MSIDSNEPVEPGKPVTGTAHFERRLANAKDKGLLDNDDDDDESEVVAVARIDMVKAVMTGPNAKYLIGGVSAVLLLFLLVTASILTGYSFHANPRTGDIYFGAAPEEAPEVEPPVEEPSAP